MSRFHKSWSSWSQRHCPILRSVCTYEFHTTSFPIQAQETIYVRARIILHFLLHWGNSQDTIICFLCLSIWKNCPLEPHRLSIDAIQFSMLKWIQKTIDLFLPSFDGIFTDAFHTQYWVGEYVVFFAVDNWTALSVSKVVLCQAC